MCRCRERRDLIAQGARSIVRGDVRGATGKAVETLRTVRADARDLGVRLQQARASLLRR